MLANVGVNSVGSSVPVLGPVFAAIFKSNERNLTLLVETLWDAAERRERASTEAVEIEIE
jgi:3-isopropylmalate dehydratase small subunit